MKALKIKKFFEFTLGLLREIIGAIYEAAERFLRDADGTIILTRKVFFSLPQIVKYRKQIYQEMLNIGYNSAFLVFITITFLGIILVLESYYHVTLVIADVSLMPGFVARMIIREGGSTITALIVICRICPGITSSIALKKETEQLDAYKMIGIDIIEFIVLPIVVATFLTLIILSLLSTVTGLFVSMITCYTHLGISAQNLWHALEFFITKADIISSFVKVLVYGMFIPIVASYCGLSCGSGATEIGKATTKSIVEAGVLVITLDLVLTWLFRFFQ